MLDQALTLEPDDITNLRAKGEFLRLLGCHGEALAVLDHALVAEPQDIVALGTKGQGCVPGTGRKKLLRC